MDEGSIDRLTLKHGEPVTANHLAQLDRNIARNKALRGAGVRRRQYPWGTTLSYFGQDGIGSAPVFQPDVSFDAQGTASVRWSGPTALIAGLVPTLGDGDSPPTIFTPDPKTGLFPALSVPRTQYSPLGECGIYFKVTVSQGDFVPIKVQPVAFPPATKVEAYTAYKLALFLRIRSNQPSYDEAEDREMFSSQGFLAVLQQQSGKFTPLWWATF
jgi:hypothetical protein